MKIVNLCAVVIAVSVFSIAVEYVYGWSDLEPVAERSANMVYEWTDGRLGWQGDAGSVSVLEGAAGSENQAN